MDGTFLKLTALACLLNSCLAFAEMEVGQYPGKSAKDNFYFGLGIGETFNHLNFNVLNTSIGFLTEVNANNTYALGNAFVGFGYTADNPLYIGAEVGTYFPKRKINFTRSSVVAPHPVIYDSESFQDYVTGDVLPGFRCHDFLIYGRLGLAYSSLSFHQDAASISPVFESHSNQLSERLGVGINYAFTHCLSLGADYIYMGYHADTQFFPRFPAFASSKLHSNYVGLSVVYST